MSAKKKDSIQIVEVGLRDGLQNEKVVVSAADRIELAQRFADAGVTRMELGAFVRADRVPQMAGSKEVIEKVLARAREGKISSKVKFSALVPNEHGFEDALPTGIKEIAIFGAASETFSKQNINCTIEESFEKFAAVVKLARKNKIKVRGYLSTCFGCPYEGAVDEKKVAALAKRMFELGCFEVSIGDTIGVANPAQIESVFKKILRGVPAKNLAGHFHDTRGTALANILRAYEMGIKVFDSSLGGLGGCPYAPGAAGNVSTEDVVYMFEGMGVKTGLDIPKMIEANRWMSNVMKRELSSRVSKAGLPRISEK